MRHLSGGGFGQCCGVLGVHHGGQVDLTALPADVVDTVGAGDAFTAGLLAAFDRDDLLTRAALTTLTRPRLTAVLAYAQRVAAITCTRPGADPPWFDEPLSAETRLANS